MVNERNRSQVGSENPIARKITHILILTHFQSPVFFGRNLTLWHRSSPFGSRVGWVCMRRKRNKSWLFQVSWIWHFESNDTCQLRRRHDLTNLVGFSAAGLCSARHLLLWGVGHVAACSPLKETPAFALQILCLENLTAWGRNFPRGAKPLLERLYVMSFWKGCWFWQHDSTSEPLSPSL